MIWGKFAELCNHKHHLLRTFPFPPKESLCQFADTLSSYPQCQTITNILSVTIDLAISYMDISYEWNNIIYVVLCLDAFTQDNNPSCIMYQYSILFIDELYSIIWIYHISFIPFTTDGHLYNFHLFPII